MSESTTPNEIVAEISVSNVMVGYQSEDETPEETMNRTFMDMVASGPRNFFSEATIEGEIIEESPVTVPAYSLDIEDTFILTEEIDEANAGDRVKVTDYTQPAKYGNGVYAYGDVETNEHRGLFTATEEMEVDRLESQHSKISIN